MNKSLLSGKIALVTGGGRGIGRATALELARLGADVAVAARSTAEIDEVAAAIKALGRRSVAIAVDLADAQSTLALVGTVEKALGPINILINNAGMVGPFGPTWTLDPAEWDRAMHINVIAPFLLARQALPAMLAADWGRIVNVSSGIAQNPANNIGAYSTTKAALDMFSRQLGGELKGTHVTTTSIYPGIVDTAMSNHVSQQETLGQMASYMQKLRSENNMAQPESPARLIAAVVLATDSALNGQIVDIHSEIGKRLLAVVN